MLWLDLGAVDSTLRGVGVPFLEVPPGLVVDFQRLEDGRYQWLGSEQAESLPALIEFINEQLEEPILQNLDSMSSNYGLKESCQVRFEPLPSQSGFGDGLGWSPGDGVFWCQAKIEADYGVAGDEWVYAGCVCSEYCFGYLYVFYNRKTGRVRQIPRMYLKYTAVRWITFSVCAASSAARAIAKARCSIPARRAASPASSTSNTITTASVGHFTATGWRARR
jgi:hypothetical protein